MCLATYSVTLETITQGLWEVCLYRIIYSGWAAIGADGDDMPLNAWLCLFTLDLMIECMHGCDVMMEV